MGFAKPLKSSVGTSSSSRSLRGPGSLKPDGPEGPRHRRLSRREGLPTGRGDKGPGNTPSSRRLDAGPWGARPEAASQAGRREEAPRTGGMAQLPGRCPGLLTAAPGAQASVSGASSRASCSEVELKGLKFYVRVRQPQPGHNLKVDAVVLPMSLSTWRGKVPALHTATLPAASPPPPGGFPALQPPPPPQGCGRSPQKMCILFAFSSQPRFYCGNMM